MSGFDFEYVDPKQLSFTLEPGDGTFKIVEVLIGESKSSGNPMMTVTFEVTDCRGTTQKINDYLVAPRMTIKNGDPVHDKKVDDDYAATKKRLNTKIMNISKAIGKPELYAPGASKLQPNDLLGYTGQCLIKTQSSDDFADRSVIAKYYDATKKEAVAVNDIDDPLPF